MERKDKDLGTACNRCINEKKFFSGFAKTENSTNHLISCTLDFKSHLSIFHNSVLLLAEGKPVELSTFTGTD